MGLSTTDLELLDGLLASAQPGATPPLAELRRRLPRLSVTRCDPFDMRDETPFRQYPGCEVYLIDGSNHCMRLTGDPECATGLVMVERKAKG